MNFAMLHEAALAEGRERGSEAVRFFIRLAQPDAALDALSENTQLLREEFNLTLVRLKLRVLEDQPRRSPIRQPPTPMRGHSFNGCARPSSN